MQDMKETQVLSLGWERSPGGGYGNPLQYSCLENPTDIRGSWWATVHRVAKSQTQLKWLSTHAHTSGQNSTLPPCSFLLLLLFFSMYGNDAHSMSKISAQMLSSKWSQNSPFCVCVSVCACSTFTIHLFYCYILLGLPWWLRQWSVCLQCGRPRFDPRVRKISCRRKWQPTSVLLP